MENMTEYYKIANWIAADIAGTITVEDKDALDRWLAADQSHLRIYTNIAKRLERGEELKSYRYKPAIKADWEKVKGQLECERGKKEYIRLFYRYVAVAVLLVGIAVAYLQLNKSGENTVLPVLAKGDTIKAGSSKAVLTLANGEKVVLEETASDSIKADGILIEKKEGGLSYQQAQGQRDDEQEVFNVISIPNGGEYRLTLADGTKVWVNSASELKYPVKFIGDTRTVYMKGEAYFEVAKDASRPFIVRTTNEMEVKVLGTHFNISAYEDDETIATTLAEGRVEVSDGRQRLSLIPNQQAVFEKKESHFTCHNVDAYRYLSWKDGKFIFEDETLESIMERLSRWYDIQFFFKGNSVRNLRFSGDLEKYDDFSTAVRMLEKVSRIKVEIKNKTIFIEER